MLSIYSNIQYSQGKIEKGLCKEFSNYEKRGNCVCRGCRTIHKSRTHDFVGCFFITPHFAENEWQSGGRSFFTALRRSDPRERNQDNKDLTNTS